jgi:hypothetical protein
MLKKIIPSTLMAAAFLLLAGTASAQCRSFVKNKCLPNMAPYKFNETFNAAQLAPGEDAEVALTFFSGQEYRVMVCSHPILGDVTWRLVDASNKIVFESISPDSKGHFDLRMESTQQMRVQVEVAPSTGRTDMVHQGCVAILLGFKE